jgi:hypothetical protein
MRIKKEKEYARSIATVGGINEFNLQLRILQEGKQRKSLEQPTISTLTTLTKG